MIVIPLCSDAAPRKTSISNPVEADDFDDLGKDDLALFKRLSASRT